MADEIVVGSANLPVKRPREEEENRVEDATSTVSMETDGGKKPDSVSATPDIVQKNQRNKNKPTGFSPNPQKNPVSGEKRGFSDAIDGCSEKWSFTVTNGSEVDVGKAVGLSSPLAKNEVSSVHLSPKPAAQLEKRNTQASEHAIASPSCKSVDLTLLHFTTDCLSLQCQQQRRYHLQILRLSTEAGQALLSSSELTPPQPYQSFD
ncbi:hypothetical protein ACFX2J_017855 [Malus domestica]